MDQVFMYEQTGVESPAVTTPYWATHIVRRNVDGRLFFARHQFGHKAYFTGEGPTFEFHPDGYTVHNLVTLYQKGKAATDGPKYYVKPEYKVGDKWWVAIPGQHHLVDAKITKVGVLIIGLEYFQDGAFSTRTFKFGDVDMYEPKAWTE